MDNIPAKVTKRPAIHDVWKLPFKSEEWDPFIWSDNNQMVFMWGIRDEDSRKRILDTLNGSYTPSGKFKARIEKAVHVVIENVDTGEETHLGIVRGWGYLHGIGGLHLDLDLAEKVHEEMCQWFVARINGIV